MAERLHHPHYLRLALAEARKSPPKPTNFCVGAVLVSPHRTMSMAPNTYDDPHVLTTGYTLECEGNTHAEQSCFIKLARMWGMPYDVPGEEGEEGEEGKQALGDALPEDVVLYTTMEPCNRRSPGNTPCVERILGLKRRDGRQSIRTVVVGVQEPETFVGVNEGRRRLEDAGIVVLHMSGMEEEILKVATAGHPGKDG